VLHDKLTNWPGQSAWQCHKLKSPVDATAGATGSPQGLFVPGVIFDIII
jgi:hypothetical protein